MPTLDDYKQLKAQCLKCTACTLAEQRTQVVVDQGPVPCDLMLIGEAPGADEDAQGIPFVGRSGKLLTKMLESVGLQREQDVYITNVCKCRPPDNRNPEREEVNACIHWLKSQIEIVQPKIIVLIGAVAMQVILGEELAITKQRGTWHTYEGVDTTIIFHPSFLLRNPSAEVGKPKWLTWQDLKAIKSALDYQKLQQVTK